MNDRISMKPVTKLIFCLVNTKILVHRATETANAPGGEGRGGGFLQLQRPWMGPHQTCRVVLVPTPTDESACNVNSAASIHYIDFWGKDGVVL